MLAPRFDALTRAMSQATSRRTVVKQAAAFVGASALGILAVSTASAHAPIRQACARLGQTPGADSPYGDHCCPGLTLDAYTNTCVAA